MATKRKEKEPEQPQSSRFLSRKHEKHFRVVQDRRLLMERKVGMIPNFAPQFGEQLLWNDWGKLATYPASANIAVVKEFYTNAKKIGDYPAENYLGYVRGHAIRYDPDSINNFLDTVWAGEQCQVSLCMEEGADYEDVERVLCIPGGHFQRNRSGTSSMTSPSMLKRDIGLNRCKLKVMRMMVLDGAKPETNATKLYNGEETQNKPIKWFKGSDDRWKVKIEGIKVFERWKMEEGSGNPRRRCDSVMNEDKIPSKMRMECGSMVGNNGVVFFSLSLLLFFPFFLFFSQSLFLFSYP
ncbi:hypothetical protein LR48_Vigan03g105800 [Vigna angularis]|uniref:Putative plant transposon protein domain-containing protein n=1 Tax=Phaseolus angularis TaxID=3914 RepID=A0A0L9U4H2_PHAAN|nr:hypothetical protein LR48_Vigan03g105800 [Vigna angularis]